jgi:transcriptional regulator with XRE-family HTH domain
MLKRRGRPRKNRISEIGEYLTEIREARGETQQEIAVKIKKTRSCICKIERGARTEKSLHGLLLYDLAKAYGAPIAEILKKANWTQLLLLDTEETQELLQYLKRVRKKKRQQEHQAKK